MHKRPINRDSTCRRSGGTRQRRVGLFVALILASSWATDHLVAHGEHHLVDAYVGPGAGIALVGSFFALLLATFSAVFVLATWPLRWGWRMLRGRQARSRAQTRRVVVLGLDGLDPELVDRYLATGALPNLARLRDEGVYARLGTTWPPLSPVAWSSFSTGTNPGKHNIYDFITRDRGDYRPRLSSTRIEPPPRLLRLGKFMLPLSRPRISLLRRSKPFWKVLGDAGVFSCVLRVPITFPPERFYGLQLAAMCVPDLRGTQGEYTHFVESTSANADNMGASPESPHFARRQGSIVSGVLLGPENPLRSDGRRAEVHWQVTAKKNGRYELSVSGKQVELELGRHSDWVRVTFTLAPLAKIRGICRFLLKKFDAPFEMYCTPINIDPEKPVMPVSSPPAYSAYLANRFGSFATLGLAEDTAALSAGVIDRNEFLEQTFAIENEREQMFFDALRHVRRGLIACVFDGPDRIQHMFWREQEHKPPGTPAAETTPSDHDAIRAMYARMDALVGRTRDAIGPDTALIVMSDHGFKPFRREVDLNAWLLSEGLLRLKDGATMTDVSYLQEVDWSATRAYAIGLAGIYLNLKGRESAGIVEPGDEANALKQRLCAALTGLKDGPGGATAIHEAVKSDDVYRGPYVNEAPDIIVGYNVGYRVSWATANGKCAATVFADNRKAWSGDHCIHPELVPGVLFSNWRLTMPHANIVDLAPTVLDLLGVKKPAFLDGKSLLPTSPAVSHEAP